jgi:hypothetical protein
MVKLILRFGKTDSVLCKKFLLRRSSHELQPGILVPYLVLRLITILSNNLTHDLFLHRSFCSFLFFLTEGYTQRGVYCVF